jgi:hypothetical protein
MGGVGKEVTSKLAEAGGVSGRGEVVSASAGGGSRIGRRLVALEKTRGDGVFLVENNLFGIETDRERVFNPSVEDDEGSVIEAGLEGEVDGT